MTAHKTWYKGLYATALLCYAASLCIFAGQTASCLTQNVPKTVLFRLLSALTGVENVFRRLREGHARPGGERRSPARVIFEASSEIRGTILFATLIVMLVFAPLFFLSGLEGRLLIPLGFAYLVAIGLSLVVAITVTPALCSFLLPGSKALAGKESPLVRALKMLYLPVLRSVLRRPIPVLLVSAAVLVGALAVTPLLGRAFLPKFNEGALTINAVTAPGTSLAEADRIGRKLEKALLAYPEVVSTARRTGRAELDEHAQDVSASEIEVRMRPSERDRLEVLADIRRDFAAIPEVVTTIGQPISHRIDHMLSGTRSSIVVKLFGDDLDELRRLADSVKGMMASVEGVVDLSIEQQVAIPQLTIRFDRDRSTEIRGILPPQKWPTPARPPRQFATRPIPTIARLAPVVLRTGPTTPA